MLVTAASSHRKVPAENSPFSDCWRELKRLHGLRRISKEPRSEWTVGQGERPSSSSCKELLPRAFENSANNVG